MSDALLKITDLKKYFPVRGGFLSRIKAHVKAVDGVDLSIASGQTLGLVGESGCGKTTVGRLIVRLLKADSGEILFEGTDLTRSSHAELRKRRADLQMIFQDPYSSLNPRMTIGEIIAEPLLIHKRVTRRQRRSRVCELLERVGLEASHYDRFPHEFSGGQRQRIGIARAIALSPKLIVADEAVSALDVSIAAQIVKLLQDLQRDLQISFLFIGHDLPLVQNISHEVAVMYLGKIVERGPSAALTRPLHPYTQALIEAVPVPDPKQRRERIILTGEVPSAINPPPACRFHPRCPLAEDICKTDEPEFKEWRPGRFAACHFADKVYAAGILSN